MSTTEATLRISPAGSDMLAVTWNGVAVGEITFVPVSRSMTLRVGADTRQFCDLVDPSLDIVGLCVTFLRDRGIGELDEVGRGFLAGWIAGRTGEYQLQSGRDVRLSSAAAIIRNSRWLMGADELADRIDDFAAALDV